MAVEISLSRIVDAIANIGSTQFAVEPTNDSTLGYKMAGYKDDSGTARKLLAKDQNARVNELTMQALIGVGDRYIGVDATGKAKVLPNPGTNTDEKVKIGPDDTTPGYLFESINPTSSILPLISGPAGTDQKLSLTVELSTNSGNVLSNPGNGLYAPDTNTDETLKGKVGDTDAKYANEIIVPSASNPSVTVTETPDGMGNTQLTLDVTGAGSAAPDQVFKKKANGEFGFEALVDIKIVKSSILVGTSTASDQQPSSLDTPQQIEFGPAQNIPGKLDLTAAGVLTILEDDNQFKSNIRVQYGRTGGVGVSNLYARTMADIGGTGTTIIQVSDSIRAKLDDSDTLIPIEIELSLDTFPINTKLWLEIVRSSADSGINSGGLFDGDPGISGWNTSATAQWDIWEEEAQGKAVGVTTTPIIDHNDTDNIQGGTATERYHLNQAEHSALTQLDFEDLGDWAGGTTYELGQVVKHDKFRWMARGSSTGQTPMDGSSFWTRIDNQALLDTFFVIESKADLLTFLNHPVATKVGLWTGPGSITFNTETVLVQGQSRIMYTGLELIYNGNATFDASAVGGTNRIQWDGLTKITTQVVDPATVTISNTVSGATVEHWFTRLRIPGSNVGERILWNGVTGIDPLRYEQLDMKERQDGFVFANFNQNSWKSPDFVKFVAGTNISITDTPTGTENNIREIEITATAGGISAIHEATDTASTISDPDPTADGYPLLWDDAAGEYVRGPLQAINIDIGYVEMFPVLDSTNLSMTNNATVGATRTLGASISVSRLAMATSSGGISATTLYIGKRTGGTSSIILDVLGKTATFSGGGRQDLPILDAANNPITVTMDAGDELVLLCHYTAAGAYQPIGKVPDNAITNGGFNWAGINTSGSAPVPGTSLTLNAGSNINVPWIAAET